MAHIVSIVGTKGGTRKTTLAWQREAAERALASEMDAYRERVLEPVPAISATKRRLQVEVPRSLPTPVNNAARARARMARRAPAGRGADAAPRRIAC